jgi:uncharacterized protein YprB with RNaseH-like and TPR domain
MATLSDALDAERQSSDLLLRSTQFAAPALAADTRDLVQLPGVCGLSDPDWVYIDTETTGLSGGAGNLAFMLGMARYIGSGELEVRQYVLGSFAAEARMLRDMLDWLGSDAVLVSYNGKCFDLPLLAGRLRIHRMDADLESMPHLDLMFDVRRAYRDHWPDCRLQTAERRLLNRNRVDDLPGAEAPAAWQSWLRHAQTHPLARVLRHNHQDVVSLALLHRRLLSDYAGSAAPGVNHTAIGRAWIKAGQAELARRVWERAGKLLDERGGLELADLYRRRGEWSRAEEIWRGLQRRGSERAALALSKYYEHRKRDFKQAMRFAGCCDAAEQASRFTRLRGKLGRNLELPLSVGPLPVSSRSG